MPFQRKTTDQHGKEITIEFSDDWNEDCDLRDAPAKEIFFQTLLAEARTLTKNPSDPHHYELASLTLSELGSHYIVLLNEAGTYDNMCRLEFCRPLPEQKIASTVSDEKCIPSSTPLTLHEPFTSADIKMVNELALREREFADWKEETNRLLIYTPKYFGELKKQIADIIDAFNRLKRQTVSDAKESPSHALSTWFQDDPLVQKATGKIIAKISGIRAKMKYKMRELRTLKLRLDNIAYELCHEHIDKVSQLLLLKQNLLNILQQTALDYHKKLLGNAEKLDAASEKYFNDLFIGIAQIKDNHLHLEAIDINQKSLKELADLFNQFLWRSNTFYNRWIGVTEPLAMLNKKIEHYSAEHKAPQYAIECKNFTFTIQTPAYHFEEQTLARCAAIREEFNRVYPAMLNKEHVDICEIRFGSQRKLEYLARVMIALANHVEAKKSELARNLAKPAPPERAAATAIAREVIYGMIDKIPESSRSQIRRPSQ